jgi:hypothetical protein
MAIAPTERLIVTTNRFPYDTAPELIIPTLERDGYVIIENLRTPISWPASPQSSIPT